MSPTLNRSSAIRRFKRGNAIETRDGITFDFYTGLPHILHPIITPQVAIIYILKGQQNYQANKKLFFPSFKFEVYTSNT